MRVKMGPEMCVFIIPLALGPATQVSNCKWPILWIRQIWMGLLYVLEGLSSKQAMRLVSNCLDHIQHKLTSQLPNAMHLQKQEWHDSHCLP